jgi:hypothetical protein
VCGSGIQIVITLLNVFAVVAFVTVQSKKTFLENGVVTVPERGSKTHPALAVGPALETVFAPAVSAAAGMVVRETFPTVAMLGIIFADGSPLALTEKGAPAPPVFVSRLMFNEPFFFPMH